MSNGETAELYSVHPYRQATIARAQRGDGIEWAKANRAFNADPQTKSDEGWNQNVMNAALLGNTSVAAKFLVARARMPLADGYRFPGFAPRVQDAAPSADHYAVFSTALQYVDCPRFPYQDCHVFSFVPSRGPSKSYQDYHMFPIIVSQVHADSTGRRRRRVGVAPPRLALRVGCELHSKRAEVDDHHRGLQRWSPSPHCDSSQPRIGGPDRPVSHF